MKFIVAVTIVGSEESLLLSVVKRFMIVIKVVIMTMIMLVMMMIWKLLVLHARLRRQVT